MSKKKASNGNETTYALQDLVLGRVKGFPPWPGRVIDPESAPYNLREDKKRHQKQTYLVKFFGTADFAYVKNTELKAIDKTAIQAFLDDTKKKASEDLRAAYRIALEPEEWEAEQVERQKAAEESRQKALQAENEREEDQLDGEGGAEGDGTGASKKRKRAKADSKPKDAKKRKAEGDTKKSKSSKAAAAAAAASDEDPGHTTVRNWRQKLQRVFLTPESPVKAETMPEIDSIYKDIESFDMTAEWLTKTKLGKVLKRIAAMAEDAVPDDAKFNIRARSRALQVKWANAFGSAEGAAPAPVDEPADPAAIPDPPAAAPVAAEVPSAAAVVANGSPETSTNTTAAAAAPVAADVEMTDGEVKSSSVPEPPAPVPVPSLLAANGSATTVGGADSIIKDD